MSRRLDSLEDDRDELELEREAIGRRIDEREALALWLDNAAASALYDVMEAIDEELDGPFDQRHRGLYAEYDRLTREIEAINNTLGWAEWRSQMSDYYAGLGVLR